MRWFFFIMQVFCIWLCEILHETFDILHDFLILIFYFPKLFTSFANVYHSSTQDLDRVSQYAEISWSRFYFDVSHFSTFEENFRAIVCLLPYTNSNLQFFTLLFSLNVFSLKLIWSSFISKKCSWTRWTFRKFASHQSILFHFLQRLLFCFVFGGFPNLLTLAFLASPYQYHLSYQLLLHYFPFFSLSLCCFRIPPSLWASQFFWLRLHLTCP